MICATTENFTGGARNFRKMPRSINGYLKEWRASGFRSGFMLHDRECLNDLDIEYDASTFDTDPFEPQPEGVNTIFPFWVPRPGGGGYVELPYTLPQDSTHVSCVAGKIAGNLEAETGLDRAARRHGAGQCPSRLRRF